MNDLHLQMRDLLSMYIGSLKIEKLLSESIIC